MEYEVEGISYAGLHETRANRYEIVLSARPTGGTRRPRASISLLFRPEDIHCLAHMLQTSLPPEAHDTLEEAIARLQT